MKRFLTEKIFAFVERDNNFLDGLEEFLVDENVWNRIDIDTVDLHHSSIFEDLMDDESSMMASLVLEHK